MKRQLSLRCSKVSNQWAYSTGQFHILEHNVATIEGYDAQYGHIHVKYYAIGKLDQKDGVCKNDDVQNETNEDDIKNEDKGEVFGPEVVIVAKFILKN